MDKYDLIRTPLRPPVRAPRSMRELYSLLGRFDAKEGWEGLLRRVDLDKCGPMDIYRIVHGRAPESIQAATARPEFNARKQFLAALLSSEFRKRALGTFLNAFPELGRDIFIHVPKCAGTDLILNVAPTRLSLSTELDQFGTASDVLSALACAASGVDLNDRIFVHGHIRLGDYIASAGVRLTDRFYSTVRDPIDLMISQVSDVLTQLFRDHKVEEPYTRDWLAYLELQDVPRDPTKSEMKDIWARALLDRRIAQPNRICTYLGKGDVATYQDAIENAVVHDVEIATTGTYRDWLRQRWGTPSSSRHNASIRMLTKHEVARLYLDEIWSAIEEDQKFYRVIDWALTKTGRSSVRGSELPDLAGSTSLLDLPDALADGRATSVAVTIPAEKGGPDMRIVEGQEAVEAYLLPLPVLGAQKRRLEVSDEIVFNVGMDVTRLGGAWHKPERDFVWSGEGECRVVLGRPSQQGNYSVRFVAAPLAGKPLPTQRITVLVNGTPMGTVTATSIAVFEVSVPWEVIARAATVEIGFLTPDAKRACDVRETGDTRVLGFAFRRVGLVQVVSANGAEKSLDAARGTIADTRTVNPEPAPATDASVGANDVPPEAHGSYAPLLTRFESLGENCEFGLVQRRCGIEPLGLLRFSSTPLAPLLRALRERFAGMGTAETIAVEVAASGREYMVFDRRFGFRYHAWVKLGEMEPAAIQAREARRLPFLIRKLIEDLTEGEKIFVFHGMEPLAEAQVRELSAAIRAYGPGTLLWVELADATHPPGSVVQIGPGLLKGHMDRFAPGENAHDLSLDCWLTLCGNAEALVHARRAA